MDTKTTKMIARAGIFSILIFLLSTSLIAYAKTSSTLAATPTPTSASEPVPQDLVLPSQSFAEEELRISYHAQTGKVRFLGAKEGHSIQQPLGSLATVSPEEAARGFMSVFGSLFGLADPAQELILEREKIVERSRSVVRFQQQYQNIPVFAGELIVQLDSANNILSVSGEVLPDITLNTTPTVDASFAQEVALGFVARSYRVGKDTLTATQPELWVYNPILLRPGDSSTSLVWFVEVTPAELGPIRELVLVDAHQGFVTLNFNQLHTGKDRETYNANKFEKSSKFLSPPQADGVLRNFAPTGTDFS